MSKTKKENFIPGSLGEALAKELGDEKRAAAFCERHGYKADAATPFSLAAREEIAEKPPLELWAERDRSKRENAFDFIARVYAEHIASGYMTKAVLRQHDMKLYDYHALCVMRRGGDDPLNLPTQSDVVTALLEQADPAMMKFYARLSSTAHSRKFTKGG